MRRGPGCTYPGDLLYSLLGAARGSSNIEVDYSQPFEVVFAKSTWQIMVQRGKLSMFSKVEKDRQASTLPTWVPDWRTRGETIGVSGDVHQYAATGSSQPVGWLSDDAKVLNLSGLIWDRISSIKSATSAELDDWANSMFATVVHGKILYTQTHETLERALRRVYYLDRTEFSTEWGTTRWKTDSHEIFEETVWRALSSGHDGRLKYGVLLYTLMSSRKSRSIIVTEGGRLGIASDNVLPGDVITMLLGGEVPIVVRPLKDKPGHFTFVSECYIHGFMDGESLIDARRSAQPEHDPADVSWLHELHANNVPFPVQEFHLH